MAYDETSTASMDNHMVMRIQFVGKNQWCEILWKVWDTIDELHCETQKLYRMLARFRDTW